MVYLDEHLKKYPLMQTQDVLKLHLQGILGPAHLVGAVENVVAHLEDEYNSVNDLGYKWDLVEEVSPLYSRVYLVPFYKKYGSFTPLAEYFKKSAVEGDVEGYFKVIASLKDRYDNDFIDRYIASGNPLIRHSATYRDNYHPHYLVVANKYLKDLLGEI
jgi:hypothetical protein